ncbi:MAG: hypothetical protein ACOC2H_00415 [Spirochaetota bacterium]
MIESMITRIPSSILSLILAFIGYSILNISQACQKIGLEKRRDAALKGWSIWTAATAGSAVSVGIVFAALSVGKVSTVGAMAGTGLISLVFFSAIVMGERINLSTIASIGVIVAGTSIVGIFQTSAEAADVSYVLIYGILASLSVLALLLWVFIPSGAGLGITIGAYAGFLGAYSQIFQKIVTTSFQEYEEAGAMMSALVSNPLNAAWITLSALSMVVLQFSFKYAPAIAIIPSFTACFIATPVVGGVIVFGEKLRYQQWIGVVIILAGAVALNLTRIAHARQPDSE